jgi:hypothetical protein
MLGKELRRERKTTTAHGDMSDQMSARETRVRRIAGIGVTTIAALALVAGLAACSSAAPAASAPPAAAPAASAPSGVPSGGPGGGFCGHGGVRPSGAPGGVRPSGAPGGGGGFPRGGASGRPSGAPGACATPSQ